jgi:hypothetical protein
MQAAAVETRHGKLTIVLPPYPSPWSLYAILLAMFTAALYHNSAR